MKRTVAAPSPGRIVMCCPDAVPDGAPAILPAVVVEVDANRGGFAKLHILGPFTGPRQWTWFVHDERRGAGTWWWPPRVDATIEVSEYWAGQERAE